MQSAPTPRDVVFRDGTAELLRFRRSEPVGGPADRARPVLLVPSLINRWYVLDLHEGASVAAVLLDAGLDVFCVDWGIPADEDRYLSWDDVIERLARMVRAVGRIAGSGPIGLLGYCMGGTLCAIYGALEPRRLAALVNLAGPIDFSAAGLLGHLVDRRWFDADAISAAGNISAAQMQAGFVALRPTAQLGKLVCLADRIWNRPERERFLALERWATDNVPFPAAAYRRYIRELYQDNQLVRGEHWIRGRRVELGAITCPVLTVVTDRDTICPPPAATALNRLAAARDEQVLTIPGGHVGAVVGPRAGQLLYPKLAAWLQSKLASGEASARARAARPSSIRDTEPCATST